MVLVLLKSTYDVLKHFNQKIKPISDILRLVTHNQEVFHFGSELGFSCPGRGIHNGVF
jgi:hypothetical protein